MDQTSLQNEEKFIIEGETAANENLHGKIRCRTTVREELPNRLETPLDRVKENYWQVSLSVCGIYKRTNLWFNILCSFTKFAVVPFLKLELHVLQN